MKSPQFVIDILFLKFMYYCSYETKKNTVYIIIKVSVVAVEFWMRECYVFENLQEISEGTNYYIITDLVSARLFYKFL